MTCVSSVHRIWFIFEFPYLLHSKSEHYNVPAQLNRKVESDNVIDKLLSDFKATKEADLV